MPQFRIKSFQTAYTVLILSSILAFTIGELYFYNSLNEQQANYNLIEITGKQRTTSFLINNQLINGVAGTAQKLSVDSLISSLRFIHKSLKTGNESLGIPVLEEGVHSCYDSLDVAIKEYAIAIKMVEGNPIIVNKINFLESQSNFIVCVDNLIDCFKRDNEQDYSRFKKISWIIHLSGVCLLLLEFFFIFIPMIRRIQRHNAKLTTIAFNQSHIIRHPLSNILGLLQLVDKSKLDQKQAEYIAFIEQEALKLDEVIRENVSTLSVEK